MLKASRRTECRSSRSKRSSSSRQRSHAFKKARPCLTQSSSPRRRENRRRPSFSACTRSHLQSGGLHGLPSRGTGGGTGGGVAGRAGVRLNNQANSAVHENVGMASCELVGSRVTGVCRSDTNAG